MSPSSNIIAVKQPDAYDLNVSTIWLPYVYEYFRILGQLNLCPVYV